MKQVIIAIVLLGSISTSMLASEQLNQANTKPASACQSQNDLNQTHISNEKDKLITLTPEEADQIASLMKDAGLRDGVRSFSWGFRGIYNLIFTVPLASIVVSNPEFVHLDVLFLIIAAVAGINLLLSKYFYDKGKCKKLVVENIEAKLRKKVSPSSWDTFITVVDSL